MDQFLRLLTLQDANTRVVLLGATVLGVASAVVGTLAVLRKRSLVGDAVAHAALPGVCIAYFVVGERDFSAFMIGALVIGVLAAAFISAVKTLTRVKEDAAIAIAIGGFFGVGIVLSRVIQNEPSGNRAGLDSFIFGKAASMVRDDARLILIVAAAVIAGVALFYKEFKLLCFDRDFATGQGWPTFLLDLLLMGLVCVCTVVGLPAVGVVLMVALLVIPPVAARFWTNRLGTMLMIAAAFGGGAGLLGTVLSATVPSPSGSLSRGWPTGPLIVLVAAALFGASMLGAPKRGLIADLVRRLSLRRRVAVQNLLRDAYESIELQQDLGAPWSLEETSRGGRAMAWAVSRAMDQDLIARTDRGYVLTKEGQLTAARVVRAHRLWELYLIEQADIAADHVDRDADQIEHILPPSVIADLEARLAQEGRLPASFGAHGVPSSPHPIRTAKQSDTAGAMRLPSLWPIVIGAIAVLSLAAPHQVRATEIPDHVSALFSLTIEPVQRSASFPALRTEAGSTPLAWSHSLVAPPLASANGAWFTLRSYQVRTDDIWTVATAVVCSVACGLVGVFLVLRRMSLLGDAISHAILPGLAVAFIVTQSREPLAMLAGALAVGVMTALLSSGLNRWGKVPEDAAMGVVFTTLFAVGVILISFAARSIDLDPGCVLYGLIEFVPFDTTSVLGAQVPRSFLWLSIVLAINLALIIAFFKELKIVCFDPYLATTMGIGASLVHYGLMTTVAATSVASFEAVGSILVIAMLVAPGATAHMLTDRLTRMLWLSAAIAAITAVAGYVLAVWWNTSVAGMIASISLAIFALAALLAPRHGILVRRVLRPRPIAPVL